MKYIIWDNDNGQAVCSTQSRKAAFTAILAHLIEADGSEVNDPIMWPLASILHPENAMPAISQGYADAWSVINQAQEAFDKIRGFIPAEL